MTLPNYRFLTISSDSEGRDWMEKAQQLDQVLERHSFELAEESVFLLFEEDECLIARSVIGPRQETQDSFRIFDRTSIPVKETVLEFSHWSALSSVPNPWMVRLERRIDQELSFRASVVTKS